MKKKEYRKNKFPRKKTCKFCSLRTNCNYSCAKNTSNSNRAKRFFFTPENLTKISNDSKYSKSTNLCNIISMHVVMNYMMLTVHSILLFSANLPKG